MTEPQRDDPFVADRRAWGPDEFEIVSAEDEESRSEDPDPDDDWPGAHKGANPVGNEVGRAGDHYKLQPRDPGGEDGGQWIEGPGGKVADVADNAVRVARSVGKPIGRPELVERLAHYHMDVGIDEFTENFGLEYLGGGRDRQVYVDYDDGVVYKVGDNSANRHEVRWFAEYKDEPAPVKIPDATLYEVDVPVRDPFGFSQDEEIETVTVVAMPYLPEDNSVDHVGMAWGPDFNPANVVANGGQLWLIDGGGL